MASKPYFQACVPTTHRGQPGRYGLHIFTGPASSSEEALRYAREACDTALAAQRPATGDGVLDSPARWRARGVCPEWVMDWEAATADVWQNESSLECPWPFVLTPAES
ncbi:hypothetical protein ACWEIM_15600 [Streptomyces sp. NPDC004778]